jgi:release factor glutamine methyltransferase
MTIKQALIKSTKRFAKIKHLSPILDAEVLLSFVLNQPKSYLFAHPEHKMTPSLEKKFNQLVSKRVQGLPIAYLLGSKEFFGLSFKVGPGILIPRPETETLVEIILEQLKNKPGLKILDLGTGSGCIVIALAKKLGPANSYFASDISSKALAVAVQNADFHKVKIKFKQGNLMAAWPKENFDVIVANLPYLKKLTPSVKYEPKQSLLAKKGGLELYEQLLKQFKRQPPRIGFFEIGIEQGNRIKKLASRYLPDYEIKIIKDLTDRTRFVQLSQKPS